MSTWGIGIFDDDLAQEVRREFQQHLSAGVSVYEAAGRIIEKHGNQNSVIVYLALASLQLDHGVIQPKIRKKALTLIITGEARERWENADPSELAARNRELQNLRDRINQMPG